LMKSTAIGLERVGRVVAACAVCGVLTIGCSPGEKTTAAGAPVTPVATTTAVSTTAAAPRVAAKTGDGLCRLLADAEVRRVFPEAKAGVPERTREQYGIRACVWDMPHGPFVLQQWDAKGGTADNEIRGLATGMLDPVNPKARNAVRFETVAGVGEQAMAMVERKDDARGILTDAAILVSRSGGHFLELHSVDLARGERAVALQALGNLGRAAVGRL
ncbi:MAG: hypothetical protein ABI156_02075, partial [Caldimonas sp.]